MRLAAYSDATASSSMRSLSASTGNETPMSPTPRTAAKLSSISSPKPSNAQLARSVQTEIDRRRRSRETYTQPLDTAPDDPKEKQSISDFIFDFTKTFATTKADRDEILHRLYPESVGRFYKELVGGDEEKVGQVSEKDFWQRYYFRCDEQRVLRQAQKRDQQHRLALGRSTQSKLLYNDLGDLVGTKEDERSHLSPKSKSPPRSILKSSTTTARIPCGKSAAVIEDEPVRSLPHLQMLDLDEDDGDEQDQTPRVFDDLDDADSRNEELTSEQANIDDCDGDEEDEKTEIQVSSSGAAAAGIRFVDDGLNEVRTFKADIVAEHTDRLPEWWMSGVPHRTLEEVLGVESVDDMDSKVVYL